MRTITRGGSRNAPQCGNHAVAHLLPRLARTVPMCGERTTRGSVAERFRDEGLLLEDVEGRAGDPFPASAVMSACSSTIVRARVYQIAFRAEAREHGAVDEADRLGSGGTGDDQKIGPGRERLDAVEIGKVDRALASGRNRRSRPITLSRAATAEPICPSPTIPVSSISASGRAEGTLAHFPSRTKCGPRMRAGGLKC